MASRIDGDSQERLFMVPTNDPLIAFDDPNEAGIDYDPATLQARIDALLPLAINPATEVDHNGEKYAIPDLPSQSLRGMMGYGHYPPSVRDITISRPDNKPWPYSSPATCLLASNVQGVWIDSHHLCCPGCGLDVT